MQSYLLKQLDKFIILSQTSPAKQKTQAAPQQNDLSMEIS